MDKPVTFSINAPEDRPQRFHSDTGRDRFVLVNGLSELMLPDGSAQVSYEYVEAGEAYELAPGGRGYLRISEETDPVGGDSFPDILTIFGEALRKLYTDLPPEGIAAMPEDAHSALFARGMTRNHGFGYVPIDTANPLIVHRTGGFEDYNVYDNAFGSSGVHYQYPTPFTGETHFFNGSHYPSTLSYTLRQQVAPTYVKKTGGGLEVGAFVGRRSWACTLSAFSHTTATYEEYANLSSSHKEEQYLEVAATPPDGSPLLGVSIACTISLTGSPTLEELAAGEGFTVPVMVVLNPRYGPAITVTGELLAEAGGVYRSIDIDEKILAVPPGLDLGYSFYGLVRDSMLGAVLGQVVEIPGGVVELMLTQHYSQISTEEVLDEATGVTYSFVTSFSTRLMPGAAFRTCVGTGYEWLLTSAVDYDPAPNGGWVTVDTRDLATLACLHTRQTQLPSPTQSSPAMVTWHLPMTVGDGAYTVTDRFDRTMSNGSWESTYTYDGMGNYSGSLVGLGRMFYGLIEMDYYSSESYHYNQCGVPVSALVVNPFFLMSSTSIAVTNTGGLGDHTDVRSAIGASGGVASLADVWRYGPGAIYPDAVETTKGLDQRMVLMTRGVGAIPTLHFSGYSAGFTDVVDAAISDNVSSRNRTGAGTVSLGAAETVVYSSKGRPTSLPLDVGTVTTTLSQVYEYVASRSTNISMTLGNPSDGSSLVISVLDGSERVSLATLTCQGSVFPIEGIPDLGDYTHQTTVVAGSLVTSPPTVSSDVFPGLSVGELADSHVLSCVDGGVYCMTGRGVVGPLGSVPLHIARVRTEDYIAETPPTYSLVSDVVFIAYWAGDETDTTGANSHYLGVQGLTTTPFPFTGVYFDSYDTIYESPEGEVLFHSNLVPYAVPRSLMRRSFRLAFRGRKGAAVSNFIYSDYIHPNFAGEFCSFVSFSGTFNTGRSGYPGPGFTVYDGGSSTNSSFTYAYPQNADYPMCIGLDTAAPDTVNGEGNLVSPFICMLQDGADTLYTAGAVAKWADLFSEVFSTIKIADGYDWWGAAWGDLLDMIDAALDQLAYLGSNEDFDELMPSQQVTYTASLGRVTAALNVLKTGVTTRRSHPDAGTAFETDKKILIGLCSNAFYPLVEVVANDFASKEFFVSMCATLGVPKVGVVLSTHTVEDADFRGRAPKEPPVMWR